VGGRDVWRALQLHRHPQPAATTGSAAKSATAPSRQSRPGRPGGLARIGLSEPLSEQGLTQLDTIVHLDEFRLGLRGQVRRVLTPIGEDVRQTVPLRYEWRYLVLAVDPSAGTLRWHCMDRMYHEYLRSVLAA
jgi:hypothetical protein